MGSWILSRLSVKSGSSSPIIVTPDGSAHSACIPQGWVSKSNSFSPRENNTPVKAFPITVSEIVLCSWYSSWTPNTHSSCVIHEVWFDSFLVSLSQFVKAMIPSLQAGEVYSIPSPRFIVSFKRHMSMHCSGMHRFSHCDAAPRNIHYSKAHWVSSEHSVGWSWHL